MELRQLYYFTVCVQAGSFSRASAALYTTQSNVSKVIRNLEDELGFELFERKQYGIALTQRGKQVYDYAQSTLGSAGKILRYARSSQRTRLNILANPDLWLSRVFCEYYREHGSDQTRYSFMTEPTHRIIERMEDTEADLGFLYLTGQQLAALTNRFTRGHLFFATLRKMPAFYDGGSRESRDACDERGMVGLVQCGDDDYSILPEWNSEEPKDQAHDQEQAQFQICVDTNDELVIRDLLETTKLGRISGTLSSAQADQPACALPDTQLLFGCLTRNDRNLDPEAIRFLKYVREKCDAQPGKTP